MLKLINFISLCDRKDCNLENVLSVPPALALFIFYFSLPLHSLFCSQTKLSLLSNRHCRLLYLLYFFVVCSGFFGVLATKSHMTKSYIFECISKYKKQHINTLRSILRKYIYKLQMHLFFIHLFKMYYKFENALHFPYNLAYGLGKINKFKCICFYK